MIPARRSPLFEWWFARDSEQRIVRSFAAVNVFGLARLEALARERPLLVVTNHTAWWDPLVALFVSARLLRADGHAMMDAKNLRRLPFFAKVGAFGVELDDPADGARAIRYAARLLDGPRRLVWIFAQGRERPVTARPLDFRRGAAEVARVARALVVPGALRYEMGSRAEPTLWISFGEPIEPIKDVTLAHRRHEEAVMAELERIERALESPHEFETLREKRASAVQGVAERALAWLTRP